MLDFNSLGANLRFAYLSSNALFAQSLKPFSISVEQWVILNMIQNEALSQKCLADILSSEASSVTRMLDTLEKNSYVFRVDNPKDRRSKLIKFNPQKKERLEEINLIAKALSDKQNAIFSQEELLVFKSFLQRMTQASTLA